MEMNEERQIPASRDKVWEALNDPEVLKASMPGCDSFDAVAENEFKAHITAKVGPVKAKFKFNVNLLDVDPPNGYTINGEGQGGAAGFAKGSATVHLSETEDGTLLAYSVKANVGGKLAQLGARLIDGTAKKMADEFFGNFVSIVGGEIADTKEEQEHEPEIAPASQKDKALPIWVYITAGIVVLALVVSAFN